MGIDGEPYEPFADIPFGDDIEMRHLNDDNEQDDDSVGDQMEEMLSDIGVVMLTNEIDNDASSGRGTQKISLECGKMQSMSFILAVQNTAKILFIVQLLHIKSCEMSTKAINIILDLFKWVK